MVNGPRSQDDKSYYGSPPWGAVSRLRINWSARSETFQRWPTGGGAISCRPGEAGIEGDIWLLPGSSAKQIGAAPAPP